MAASLASNQRLFAVLPAGGESLRMGQPKLRLLHQGQPLLSHTIAALKLGGAAQICVVLHPSLGDLAPLCLAANAIPLVLPHPTSDMKQSVLHGLNCLAEHYQPSASDAWFLSPADLPFLSPRITQHLATVASSEVTSSHPTRSILIPTLTGKKGHPILLPWSIAAKIAALPADKGINALLKDHPCTYVSCDAVEPQGLRVFADIDTPEDYARWISSP